LICKTSIKVSGGPSPAFASPPVFHPKPPRH
jgi:hypothetical protein